MPTKPLRSRGAVAAAAWLLCGGAWAGDLYLRGDATALWPRDTTFADVDCASTEAAALFGCGTGADGLPTGSRGGFDTAAAIGLGLGYATAGRLRIEAVADYSPRVAFGGRTNFLAPERRQSVATEVSAVSAMAVVYLELGEFRWWSEARPIVPYVGLGGGAARMRIGSTTMTFPATTTTAPGGGRTNFAWLATAGFGMRLNARYSVDVAWRYADFGEIRTARGGGQVVWRDGSRSALSLDIAPTRAPLKANGVGLAVRAFVLIQSGALAAPHSAVHPNALCCRRCSGHGTASPATRRRRASSPWHPATIPQPDSMAGTR